MLVFGATRGGFSPLAIVSALLTNFVTYVPPAANFPTLGGMPILPGVYFGLVLCVGVHLWEKMGPLALAVVLVGVVIAWILAWRTAISVSDFLNQLHAGDTADSRKFRLHLRRSQALCEALVRKSRHGDCRLAREPRLPRASDWLRPTALGTVAGALMHFGDEPNGTSAAVIVWQCESRPSSAGLIIRRTCADANAESGRHAGFAGISPKRTHCLPSGLPTAKVYTWPAKCRDYRVPGIQRNLQSPDSPPKSGDVRLRAPSSGDRRLGTPSRSPARH